MSRPRTDARALAQQVLRRVRRDAAYANLALDGALRRARKLPQAERALATELVYGVLRHQRLLDHALVRHLSRPIARVNADVLDVLRMGAYQLLMLDRIPAHAAVNEAVHAAGALGGGRVGGFVNAVLRRLKPADLNEGLPADGTSRLAVEASLPDDLATRLVEQLGLTEARALALGLLERAPLVARVNGRKTTVEQARARLQVEGAQVASGSWSPAAVRVSGLPEPFGSQTFLEGLWTAQDEAAQLVGALVDPRPGQAVLDACAGVGGKSTHLAELMHAGPNQGRAGPLCVDLSETKLELLREHCRRLDVHCETLQTDLTEPGALGERRFDRVLLDAPCTGLGVLRRHPELKWRWAPRRLQELVQLQRKLLDRAVAALRPGGILVYAVCTVTDQEGPDQLRWLLSRHTGLRLQREVPEGLAELMQDGALRTWPHRHGVDGFYAARLVLAARNTTMGDD